MEKRIGAWASTSIRRGHSIAPAISAQSRRCDAVCMARSNPVGTALACADTTTVMEAMKPAPGPTGSRTARQQRIRRRHFALPRGREQTPPRGWASSRRKPARPRPSPWPARIRLPGRQGLTARLALLMSPSRSISGDPHDPILPAGHLGQALGRIRPQAGYRGHALVRPDVQRSVIALQRAGSHRPVGVRDGLRMHAVVRAEPSRAVSMTFGPAPAQIRDHISGMADAKAHKKGMAA